MTFTKHIPCLILLWANAVITDFVLSNKITLENKAARTISIIREKLQRITETIAYSDIKSRVLILLVQTDWPFFSFRMNVRSGYLCRINILIYICLCIWYIPVYVSVYLYVYLIWASGDILSNLLLWRIESSSSGAYPFYNLRLHLNKQSHTP